MLTATERARLIQWRTVYVLGATYGRDVAQRLLFLRWLVATGRLVSGQGSAPPPAGAGG